MREIFVKDVHSIVVKIGTSILTKDGMFDRKMLDELAGQVTSFLKRGIRVAIVSSGAIGAGMVILSEKKRPKTMEGLQAAAAVGQRYLMQCWEDSLSKRGFSTGQVLLTWDDLAHKNRFMNAKRTLLEIQRRGLVPIINENDTVATDEIRFGDNDKLSALIAVLLETDVLVILSDTNGLYSRRDGIIGDRIQIVEKMKEDIFTHVHDRTKKFTVGGMRSKLNAIRMGVRAGIPVFLASGRDKNVLAQILKGSDVGTLFIPELRRGQSRKNWLKVFLSLVKK